MAKRKVYTVEWDKGGGRWRLLWPDGAITWFSTTEIKKDVVAFAAAQASVDRPSELVIKTKSGRIGKGSSGRRSYGSDPEKSKG